KGVTNHGHTQPVPPMASCGCFRHQESPSKRDDAGPVGSSSGFKSAVHVLVDVVGGDHWCIELNLAGNLNLDQIAHVAVLGDQPGQADAISTLGGGVNHGCLNNGVSGFDLAHHIRRTGTANHEEIIAAGVLDGGQHADSLVVVMVPDCVDFWSGLQ